MGKIAYGAESQLNNALPQVKVQSLSISDAEGSQFRRNALGCFSLFHYSGNAIQNADSAKAAIPCEGIKNVQVANIYDKESTLFRDARSNEGD